MLHRKSRKIKDIRDESEETKRNEVDLKKLAANVRKAEQIINKFAKQTEIVKLPASRMRADISPLPVSQANWTEGISLIANVLSSSADSERIPLQQKLRLKLDTDGRIDDFTSTNYFGPQFTGYEQLSHEQYESLVEQALKQYTLDGEKRQIQIRAKRVRWVKGTIVAVGVTTIVGLSAGALAGYPVLAYLSADALKTTAWYTVFVIWPSVDGYRKAGWKGFAKEALQVGTTELLRSVNVVGYLFPAPTPGVYERWSRWGARMVATGVELSGKEIVKGAFSAVLHIEDTAMLQRMASETANRAQRSLWIENRLRNGESLEGVMRRFGEQKVDEKGLIAFVRRFGQKGKLLLNSGIGKLITTMSIALASAMYYFDISSKLSTLWKLPYVQEKVGDYVIEPGARLAQTFLIPVISRYILMNKLRVPQMVATMFHYMENKYGLLRKDIRDLPPMKKLFQMFEKLFGQEIKWNLTLTAAANLVTANTLVLIGTEAMLPIADPKRVRWFYDHWDTASTVNGLTDVFKSVCGKGDFWALMENPLGTALPWLYNHVSKVSAGDIVLDYHGNIQFTITKVDNLGGIVTARNSDGTERVVDLDKEGPVLDEFYLRNPATSKLTPIRVGRLRADGIAEAFQLQKEPIRQEEIDAMVSRYPTETKRLIDLAKKTRSVSENLSKLETSISAAKSTFELTNSLVESASMSIDDPWMQKWRKAIGDVVYENLFDASKTALDEILQSDNPTDDKVTKIASLYGGFNSDFKKTLAKEINSIDAMPLAIRNSRYFKVYSDAISTSTAKGLFAWKKHTVDSHFQNWMPTIPDDAPIDSNLLDVITKSQDESNPITQLFLAQLDKKGFATAASRGTSAIHRWTEKLVVTWGHGGIERNRAISAALAADTLISKTDVVLKLKDMFKVASQDLLTESLEANPVALSDKQASHLYEAINDLRWLSNSRMDASAQVAAAEIKGLIKEDRLQDALLKLQPLVPEADLLSVIDTTASANPGLKTLTANAERDVPERLRHPTLYRVADVYNEQTTPSFKTATEQVNKEVSSFWRAFGWDVNSEVKKLMGSFDDTENIKKLSEYRKNFAKYKKELSRIVDNLADGIDRRKIQTALLASKIQQAELDKSDIQKHLSKANNAFSTMASILLDTKEGRPLNRERLAQVTKQITVIENKLDRATQTVASRGYGQVNSIESEQVRYTPLDPTAKAKYSSNASKADMNSKLNRLEALGVSKTALQHSVLLARFAVSTSTNTKNLDALAAMLGFLVSTSGEDSSSFTMSADAVAAINEVSDEMDEATERLTSILTSLGEDTARCMNRFTYLPEKDATDPPGYESCLLPALLGRPTNAAIDTGIVAAQAYALKKLAFQPLNPTTYLTLTGAYGAKAAMTVVDTYGIANTPNMFSIIESDESTADDRAGAALGILMAGIRCSQSSPPSACHAATQLTGGVPTGRVTGYWTWMDFVVTAPDMITPDFVKDVTKILTSAKGGLDEKVEAAKAVARILTTSAAPLVETLLYGSERTSMLRVHYDRYKELMAKSDRSHFSNAMSGLSHLGLDIPLITKVVGSMKSASCMFDGVGCDTTTN